MVQVPFLYILILIFLSRLWLASRGTLGLGLLSLDLGLNLDVMRAEELLNVQEGNLGVSRGLEELGELVIHNNHTTIVWMLEPLLLHIGGDELGHLTAGDELTLGQAEELAEPGRHILLAVETVVGRPCLGLLTVGILWYARILRTILARAFTSFVRASIAGSTSMVAIFYHTRVTRL